MYFCVLNVQNKMDDGEYQDVQQFAADVRLIFSNCYKYNPPHHSVVAMARKLQVCSRLLHRKGKELTGLHFFYYLLLGFFLPPIVFQGVFEQRFAKMPDEHVEISSPAPAMSAKRPAFCGLRENGSSSGDKSESADVEEQVGSCRNLYKTLLPLQMMFYTLYFFNDVQINVVALCFFLVKPMCCCSAHLQSLVV